MRPIEFVYSINMGRRYKGLIDHIPFIIISELSRKLGFIERISREFHGPYTHETLYTSTVRPNLKHLAFGRLTSQFILSDSSECNTILFVIWYIDCRGEWGRCQFMMQDVIGLEVLSHKRIVVNALFARVILVDRVKFADLSPFYSRWRNARLLTFFHRSNYGTFEPVNNAIINFNKFWHWFGFCGEVGYNMFRDRLKSALIGERFGHWRLQ
jgi:hypothetical protein